MRHAVIAAAALALAVLGTVPLVDRAAPAHATVSPRVTASQAPAGEYAGAYVPVAPRVVLDTGYGVGAPRRPMASRGVLAVKIAGVAVPADGAYALALRLIAYRVHGPGYVTAWASGEPRPGVIHLAVTPGGSSTSTVARLGSNGYTDFANASATPLDLRVVVDGYYVGGAGVNDSTGSFRVPQAVRWVDSSHDVGRRYPLAANQGMAITWFQHHPLYDCNLPVLAMTVTAVRPGAAGYFDVHDDGPHAATRAVSFGTGTTTSAFVMLPVGRADAQFRVDNHSSGPTDVAVDVLGFTCESGTGDRAGMTRAAARAWLASGWLAPRQVLAVQVADRNGAPHHVRAASLSLTVYGAARPGSLSAYVAGSAPRWPSSLLYPASDAKTDTIDVPVGGDGRVLVRNDGPVRIALSVVENAYVVDDGRLYGYVLDETQAPVPDAVVRVAFDDNNPTVATTVRSDASGRFEIRAQTGWVLVCSAPTDDVTPSAPLGYSSSCDVEGNPRMGVGGFVTAGQDNRADIGVTRAAELTGRVVDDAGNPLTGVTVFVNFPDGAPDVHTGPDGSFEVRGIPAGAAGVCFQGIAASGPGYSSYSSTCDPTRDYAVGQRITDPDIVLHPAGSLSGTVTDGGGHPLADVVVAACDTRCSGARGDRLARTDRDGHYQIAGLAGGSYTVLFAARDSRYGVYSAGWWRTADVTSEGDPVSVTAAEDTPGIDRIVLPASTVQGTVTSADGTPLDAIVEVGTRPGFGSEYGGSGYSYRSGGTYTVSGVSSGSWYVCASASGYQDACYHVGSDTNSLLTVPPATTLTGIDIVLTPA